MYPLPAEAFQPFTPRDASVLAGLARRAEVVGSADLAREVAAMQARQVKVEIEALYAFGFEHLAHFILQRLLHFEAERDAEAERHSSPAGTHGGSRREDGAEEEAAAASSAEDDPDCEEARVRGAADAEEPASEDPTGGAGSSDEDERFLLEEPPDW